MRTANRLARLLAALLRLYPRPFQEQFGEELASVFAQMLREAAQRGKWSVWAVFLRELAALPLNLLHEHLSGTGASLMIEKVLTHPKYSRWRQAGALGFAAGFALMELVNGLSQLAFNHFSEYVSWNGWIKVNVMNTPSDAYEAAPFQPFGVLLLAVCGLAAGVLLSRGEKPPRVLRYTLAAGASLPLAYTLLYGLSCLLALLPSGAGRVFISVAFNLLVIVSSGGPAAALLGLFAGVRAPRRLALLGMAGFAGWFVALLASGLALLVWGVLNALVGTVYTHFFTQTGVYANPFLTSPLAPIGGWLAGMASSAVFGWVYGSWVGNELGAGRSLGSVPKSGENRGEEMALDPKGL